MTDCKKPSTTLAVIGKTGTGKSSSANTLLGREAFTSTDNATSCTLLATACWAERDGVEIKVVDTPGVMDTNKEQEIENIEKHIPGIMASCPEGIHALLLVLRYGVRFTEEDANAVKKIKSIFGEKVFTYHGIIIMTHGENFDIAHDKEGNIEESFKKWCNNQSGPIQKVFQECQNRIVLFYNSNNEIYKQKKLNAVKKLMAIVNDVSAEGPYTNEKFDKCYREREKLNLEHRLPELSLEFQKKIDLLMQDVLSIQSTNAMTENDLKRIKEQCNNLLHDIQLKSNNTDLMDDFKDKVVRIKNNLDRVDLTRPAREQLTPVMVLLEILKNPPMSLVVAGTIISSLAIVAGAVVLTVATCGVAPAVGMALGGAALTTSGATSLGASIFTALRAFLRNRDKKQL